MSRVFILLAVLCMALTVQATERCYYQNLNSFQNYDTGTTNVAQSGTEGSVGTDQLYTSDNYCPTTYTGCPYQRNAGALYKGSNGLTTNYIKGTSGAYSATSLTSVASTATNTVVMQATVSCKWPKTSGGTVFDYADFRCLTDSTSGGSQTNMMYSTFLAHASMHWVATNTASNLGTTAPINKKQQINTFFGQAVGAVSNLVYTYTTGTAADNGPLSGDPTWYAQIACPAGCNFPTAVASGADGTTTYFSGATKTTGVSTCDATYGCAPGTQLVFKCGTGTTLLTATCNVNNDVNGKWSNLPTGCTGNTPVNTPPGGSGDPQFAGLQGQNFQFHGLADEYFNLITSPSLQVNSLFKFISSGTCTYNNTQCWTHPGTYLGTIGIRFGKYMIRLASGAHSNGATVHLKYGTEEAQTIEANGKIIALNKDEAHTGRLIHKQGQVRFESEQFILIFHNADYFFNFQIALKDAHILEAGAARVTISKEVCANKHKGAEGTVHAIHEHVDAEAVEAELRAVYPDVPLHGLIGQSWMNARFCNGRQYAGEPDDYVTGSLFGTDFKFNKYEL